MSKDTHIVLKKFTSEEPALVGTIPRGKKFDGTQLNPAYLAGLERSGFVKKIGADNPPSVGGDVKKSQGLLGEGRSIGSLDGSTDGGDLDTDLDEEDGPSEDTSGLGDSLDLDEDGETDDSPDGSLVPQKVISDTPITAEIEAVEKGNKNALKAVADKHKSEVRRNLGFDNMKRELLEEFKGK